MQRRVSPGPPPAVTVPAAVTVNTVLHGHGSLVDPAGGRGRHGLKCTSRDSDSDGGRTGTPPGHCQYSKRPGPAEPPGLRRLSLSGPGAVGVLRPGRDRQPAASLAVAWHRRTGRHRDTRCTGKSRLGSKTVEKSLEDPKCVTYQNSHGQPRQSRLRNLRSEGHEIGLAKGLGFRAAGSAEPSDSDRRRDSSFRKDRNHCDFRRLEMDLECTHCKTVQPTVEDALLAVLIFINYRMKNEIYVVFSATIVLH